MFQIKTYIDKSDIHGMGVFANEIVPMGTIVWVYDPDFDNYINVEDVNKLPEAYIDFINRQARVTEIEGRICLCGDDARFTNHSDDPNIEPSYDDKGSFFAVLDLKPGDEITVSYNNYKPGYLKTWK